jgi:hypothetical protein
MLIQAVLMQLWMALLFLLIGLMLDHLLLP